MLDPTVILKRAIGAVPAVRFALGIGGLLAVISLIGALGLDFRVAGVGTVALLVAMVALLLFASASGLPGERRNIPALVFTWFSLLVFIATAVLLLVSVFFSYPLNLRSWLESPPRSESTVASSPAAPSPAVSAATLTPSEAVPHPVFPATSSVTVLPVGVTSERQNRSQVEVKLELASTGTTRSYFFSKTAELETVRDVITASLDLEAKQLLGNSRRYEVLWVLVEKALGHQWRALAESTRHEHALYFRSAVGDVITIERRDLWHDKPVTIASAKLPDGIVFNLYPILYDPPPAMAIRPREGQP